MVDTSVGSESFSDLDFADDVALLAEMLSLLVLALVSEMTYTVSSGTLNSTIISCSRDHG